MSYAIKDYAIIVVFIALACMAVASVASPEEPDYQWTVTKSWRSL